MRNIVKVFEQFEIRFVEHPEGKFDFGIVAEDMAMVLEASSGANLARSVDDEWKGSHTMTTPGGVQFMTVIWEPGIYQVLAKSRKPQAKPFQKWVFEEVLPSIRKNGSYSQKPKNSLEVLVMQTRSLAEYAEEMLALQQKQDALIEAQNQLQIQTEEIKQKQSVFEVRQQNLKNTVRQTENRVDRLDSELERFIDPDGGFYTVRAFAKNHNINVTMSDAISLGKLAKRASEQMGYRIGKVKDVRFGQVNAYHEDVLEQVFDAALT